MPTSPTHTTYGFCQLARFSGWMLGRFIEIVIITFGCFEGWTSEWQGVVPCAYPRRSDRQYESHRRPVFSSRDSYKLDLISLCLVVMTPGIVFRGLIVMSAAVDVNWHIEQSGTAAEWRQFTSTTPKKCFRLGQMEPVMISSLETGISHTADRLPPAPTPASEWGSTEDSLIGAAAPPFSQLFPAAMAYRKQLGAIAAGLGSTDAWPNL